MEPTGNKLHQRIYFADGGSAHAITEPLDKRVYFRLDTGNLCGVIADVGAMISVADAEDGPAPCPKPNGWECRIVAEAIAALRAEGAALRAALAKRIACCDECVEDAIENERGRSTE